MREIGDFGEVAETITVEKPFTITNTGQGTLSGTLALSDDAGGVFALASGTETSFVLGANQQHTFTLALTHNDGQQASPFDVALLGTGTSAPPEPVLALSPVDALAFGNVVVGATVLDMLVLTNAGSGTLVGSFSLPSATGFTFVSGSVDAHSGGFTLETGQQHEVAVSFAPLAAGAHGASVVFLAGVGGALDTLVLSGVGTLSTTAVARYYYLSDHLGSVRSTVNEAGTVVHYDDYYPFGMPMPGRSDAQGAEGDPTGKPRFTGHEQEVDIDPDEKAVFYAGARYYDALIGRWNAVDPLFEKHPDWTPYNYVLGNPLLLIDPDGRQTVYWQALQRDPRFRGEDGKPLPEPQLGPVGQAIDEFAVGISPAGIVQDISDAHQGDPLALLGPLGDAVKLGAAVLGVLGLARFADEAGELADAAGDALKSHQIAAEAAAKHSGLFQCMECADDIVSALQGEGISGKILDVVTTSNRGMAGNIYSDALGKNIATNGRHRAILVDGKVFDNLHPNGISYDEWLKDLNSPTGFKVTPTDF